MSARIIAFGALLLGIFLLGWALHHYGVSLITTGIELR